MLEIGINAFMLVNCGGVWASTFKADHERGWAFTRRGRVAVLEAPVTLGEGGSADEFLASDIFAIHVDTALKNELGC